MSHNVYNIYGILYNLYHIIYMSYAENFGKQKKVLNKKGFEKEIKIIIGSPI